MGYPGRRPRWIWVDFAIGDIMIESFVSQHVEILVQWFNLYKFLFKLQENILCHL